MPCGADPRSARVPLDPFFTNELSFIDTSRADGGVVPRGDPRTRGSAPQGNPPMSQPRVAVIGAGAFGQNHCRVVHESARASLAAIVDTAAARAHDSAARYQTAALTDARAILQVGHRGRFTPAVLARERRVTLPLFFEIHRMNLFSPRSLDVDVVLDLMIHDVDLVLALTGAEPEEIRAAGISILSGKV